MPLRRVLKWSRQSSGVAVGRPPRRSGWSRRRCSPGWDVASQPMTSRSQASIANNTRNHRRMPMPYRATLPVRSKRGAVQRPKPGRRHLRRDGARPDGRLRRASIRDQQGGAASRSASKSEHLGMIAMVRDMRGNRATLRQSDRILAEARQTSIRAAS
jgi:hypothetical protein